VATTRGRLVRNNEVVLDQADYFQPDGFTRVTGLTTAQLQCAIFFNNTLLTWTFLSGDNVPNAQVASGHVYFCEVLGSPGYYNVRFRPNAVGYWRLLLTYVAGEQIMAQDFDVSGAPPNADVGLSSSFIKPSC
jgi:hypothetical protein